MPGFRAGTAVQIVPAAAAPTKLAANGEIWIDSTASNVLKYTNPAGSTITLGSGGGSTGNWTFSGNGADLTGAATMSIASSVANALQLGNSGITVTSVGNFTISSGRTFTLGGAATNTITAIGTAQTAGLTLSNTTAATAGSVQQNSPMSSLSGTGWETGSSSSKTVSSAWQITPVSQSAIATRTTLWETTPGINSGNPNEIASFSGSFFGGNIWAMWLGPVSQGTYMFSNSGQFIIRAASGTNQVTLDATSFRPGDLGATLGRSTERWTESWSRRYAGVEQTVAGAATLTLDPASGETIRLTLNATAINAAGISAGTGYPGERISVECIQDATGSRTLTQANFSSSWVFAGGAYTVTATANKRDVLTFIWDATASKWYEASRAVNL